MAMTERGVVHQNATAYWRCAAGEEFVGGVSTTVLSGMTAPLPYFPKTALAGVEAGFSRGKWVDDEEKSLKKMADTFNDSFAFTGEDRDTYISRIWPKWDDELAAEVANVFDACVVTGGRLAAATSGRSG
ncbi:hypothetical protein OK016_13275 [Vibrio chagasii]|nr:hypothetical protein [Vibrio chagasii]